jgi:hypothetical protein
LSCFQHVPSIPWESWKPPRELERAAPRPVRLTGEGTAICLVSVFPIVGGAALGIGTAREDFRRDAEEAAAARRIFAAARLLPFYYEFPLLGCGTCQGSYGVNRNPPPEGPAICVLCVPDGPSRIGTYPPDLVKLATN